MKKISFRPSWGGVGGDQHRVSFVCPRNGQEHQRLGTMGRGTRRGGEMAEEHLGPLRSRDRAHSGAAGTVMRPSRTRVCQVQCHVICCATSNITPSPYSQPTEKSANTKASIMGPLGIKGPGGEPVTAEVTLCRSCIRGASKREMEVPKNAQRP